MTLYDLIEAESVLSTPPSSSTELKTDIGVKTTLLVLDLISFFNLKQSIEYACCHNNNYLHKKRTPLALSFAC